MVAYAGPSSTGKTEETLRTEAPGPAGAGRSSPSPRGRPGASPHAGAGRRGNPRRALYEIVSEIGKGWSLDDAEGAWLTLYAYSRYRVTRIAATFAQHTVTLTVASGGRAVLHHRGAARGGEQPQDPLSQHEHNHRALAFGTPVQFTVQAETAGTKGTPHLGGGHPGARGRHDGVGRTHGLGGG